jgi:hypothetical protein
MKKLCLASSDPGQPLAYDADLEALAFDVWTDDCIFTGVTKSGLRGTYGRHQCRLVVTGSRRTVWVAVMMQAVMAVHSCEEAVMRPDVNKAARRNHNRGTSNSGRAASQGNPGLGIRWCRRRHGAAAFGGNACCWSRAVWF